MSVKRPRTDSSSNSPSSSSPPLSPTTKQARSSQSTTPLICQLPPTCSRNPTELASTRDMDVHYATYHAHVCEYGQCNCVFPDDRFLQLHLTECHDPMTQLKKERGEKTFACFQQSCTRIFSTPKTRRLHLIEVHGYPKQFFFAVTNKGIGGLLTRWGDSVSMLRGEWKERKKPEDLLEETDDANHDDDDQMRESAEVDALTDSLHDLTLVPNSIHFGVGSRKVGFIRPAGMGRERANSLPSPGQTPVVRFAQENTVFEIPRRAMHMPRARGASRGSSRGRGNPPGPRERGSRVSRPRGSRGRGRGKDFDSIPIDD